MRAIVATLDEPGMPPRQQSPTTTTLDVIPPVVRAIRDLGIPGVIAIFLVWTGAKTVPALQSAVEALRDEHVATRETIRAEQQQNRDLVRNLIAREDLRLRLMRKICLKLATDQRERDSCYEE